MQNPKEYYSSKIATYQEQLKKIQTLLFSSSMIRLGVFLIGVAAIYFLWENTRIIIAVIVVEIILFLALVSRHSRLKYKRDFIQEMISINETEIKVLNRDYYDLPDGESFNNPLHEYSQDIDLFGRGSFFQYLNRTGLESGKQKLAALLTSNSINGIPEKQEAAKELSDQPDWRQQFRATAALVEADYSASSIINWLNGYKSFIPKIMRWLPNAFSVASVTLFVLAYLDFISSNLIIWWFFIGLGVSAIYVKKITDLWAKSSKTQTTFEQYYRLMLLLEEQEFTSVYLKREQDKIKSQKAKASTIIEQFSKMLGILDQRSNMFVGVFINAFFLSDLRQCFRIEKWIATHADEVANWFEVIAFFDAQNSLGNFRFNHPNYAFAAIKSGNHTLKATDLAHPLLDPKKAIANDFNIDSEQFFIITGANMAGKSTFLRTVSLSIVMSNAGLPICAKEAIYCPIKLITSMRTSDSLTDDESYFFSELKRLQFIVNAIKTDTYFIILDEILKGTNSTDKAIGSRKFIEKLVASNSTGIIATHDLSLCEAADILDDVKNYYFDAQIKNDELFFDYTFKKGICQNMNASFLLRKMNIIDS
ncbi:MutS-like protein [Leeuwenhoekiella aestuarii]|uniref:MutS-like protein n=1 Tax=Leeuwenhoekiella aestuarii TaxID=2249426 RepID=A0A4Q0P0T6_9FLAO|nr:DNA mismatch repair protein MutS [Leeuwenhoekiella aestuarii]RXG18505.1 MutS-like protein [Leeuwenhoekiella aestuarii]RXG19810.1 MutS-like protein [Leeuwenhoekiella aestuarii]